MSPSGIDFSAFDLKSKGPRTGMIIGIFGLALVPVGFILLWITSWQGARIIGGLIFALTAPTVFGGFGLLMKQRQAVNLLALAKFVVDNGWQFTEETTAEHVPTSLLGVGYDERIVQSFAGIYRGLPMCVILYEYTTGSGKSQTVHQFASVYFSLPEQFPLIVLDNAKTGFWDLESTHLPERIPGGISLRLEGDFNKSYGVTVIPSTEQEVLEFLTPDFMSELLSAPKQTDVELEADKLFIIEHNMDLGETNLNKTGLQSLFATADIVIKHLQELAPTWQASSAPSIVNQMAATALAPRNKIILRPKHIAGLGGLFTLGLYIAFLIIGRHH